MNHTNYDTHWYLRNKKIRKALTKLVQGFVKPDNTTFYWYREIYQFDDTLHIVLMYYDDIVNFHKCLENYYSPNIHKHVVFSFGTESMFCFNTRNTRKGAEFCNLFELVHSWLEKLNIDPCIVSFYNGNQLIESAYTSWCEEQNVVRRMSVGWYDVWAAATIKTHSNYLNRVSYGKKPKYFSCLNNKPRWHRLKTLEYMHDNNLLEHGACSFVFNDDAKDILEYTFNRPDLIKYIPMCKDGWQSSNDVAMLSNTPIHQELPELDSYFSYFNETYFDVITETIFNSNDWFHTKHGLEGDYWHNVFFTEKIFRSILFKRPFVLLGGTRSLEILKSHGFKTFDMLFDESYDIVSDPTTRLNMALDTVKDLVNSVTLDELHERINSEEVQSVLEHNYKTIFDYAEKNKSKVVSTNAKSISWQTHPINPNFKGFDNIHE